VSRTPTRSVVGAVALCLALLTAGCSSSGSDDAEKSDKTTTTAKPSETTTTEAEETTTTEANSDDAQARAEAVQLTEDDFPTGWSAEPADETDDDPSPIDECDPSFADDSDEIGSFMNDDFVNGDVDNMDGTFFSLETKVFVDEDAAVAALAPFADDEVISCMNDGLIESMASDSVTMSGELVADDSYDITTADETQGAYGEYTLSGADGSEVKFLVVVVLIRTGDIASNVTIMSIGDSLDPSELENPMKRIEELQAS